MKLLRISILDKDMRLRRDSLTLILTLTLALTQDSDFWL
jgi:hypothetical protein